MVERACAVGLQKSRKLAELRDRALQLLSCLRQILIGFADNWDKGSKAFFIDDPDNPQSLHIALRVQYVIHLPFTVGY